MIDATAELFPDADRRAPAARSARGTRKLKPVDLFAKQCRDRGLPEHSREWMFAKSIGRRWLFDFAFLEPWKLAVEIEGLVVMRVHGELVVKGRHASITGFREDCVKYASAALLGWTVLRFEQSQVKAGDAIEYTMRVLAARGWTRTKSEWDV